ncbi:family 43 glycosylhydrolase, partial [Alkalihalobacillus hemicellulosilyticus]|uniref:family 43 glycosylhydrolase n=1 Tax=Halalkalibacter hemicellulosilyticus TaxID=127886 RepID=UPI0009DFBE49
MKKHMQQLWLFGILIILLVAPFNVSRFVSASNTTGGNPVITERFSADPAALVYDGKVYLYVGHDQASESEDFYVMPKWDIYSSTDMENWVLEGSVPRTIFEWASGDSAWAAQAIERDGTFYWYTTVFNPEPGERGYSIGVAVSDDSVEGWEDAIGEPLISNSMTDNPPEMGDEPWDNIDPTVFIDDDGQAYLYWGNTHLYYVKLKDNMIELDGEIHQVHIEDMHGFFTEGPWLHKHNDIYYLSFAMNWPEDIGYAMSDSPTGPWTYAGKLMDATEGTGTNHPAILEYENEWFFLYHTAALPTGGDYRRSVSVERMHYYPDGSIKKMRPTASGINGNPTLLQVSNRDEYVFYSNGDIRFDERLHNRYNYQWFITSGLANNGDDYVSFQAEHRPGYYLKVDGTNLVLEKNDGTEAFKEQATFKVVSTNEGKRFHSYNHEQKYIWQQDDGSLEVASGTSGLESERSSFHLKEANVTGITTHIGSNVLKEGTKMMLTASVLPENSFINDVRFFSSNPDVVNVSQSYIAPNGEVRVLVSAESRGSADIVAVTEDGHHSSVIELEVENYSKQNVEMEGVDISFDSSTNEVHVNGVISSDKSRVLTVKAIDPDGNIEFIEEIQTSDEGAFSFNYHSTGSYSGEYVVQIYEKDLDQPYQTSFTKSPELTAHYDFSGNLQDRTGHHDSGIVIGDRLDREGGEVDYMDGIIDQAVWFDGESGIRLPNGLINSHTYSVSLWLNPVELTQFTTTFFGARDMNNWISVVPRGGNGQTLVWSGSERWYDANTRMTIQPNEWSHVAFTISQGHANVYINGDKVYSGSNFPHIFSHSDAIFSLGVNYWDSPYHGLLDELKIYNKRALSEAEIIDYYEGVIHLGEGDEGPGEGDEGPGEGDEGPGKEM